MGMVLRRIALENFRKFREPHEITDLADGLNIIVEPNETGKSTVMEAVRAALFLRHGSKTQLIQSFQPYGDTVAPEVELDFEIDGAPYSLVKRFISKQHIELTGPDGRSQGDAAEEKLQSLLGFDKQSTRFDANGLGALGLLWVAQGDGLSLPTPTEAIREGISGALEGHAGAILSSDAFERVRARIDTQYARFKTPTGQKKGELKEAEARVVNAEQALQRAEQKEAALEQAYGELERARGNLELVIEELASDDEGAERAKLQHDLGLAKSAALKLETEQARHVSAQDRFTRLSELSTRYKGCQSRVEASATELKQILEAKGVLDKRLSQAKISATESGAQLKSARSASSVARKALDDARKRVAERRKSRDIDAAHQRHTNLLQLEKQQEELDRIAEGKVDEESIEQLVELESRIEQDRANLQAGGVRVEYEGPAGVTLDGKPMAEGAHTITQKAEVGLADGGKLLVHPPSNLVGAEARLASAEQERSALLAELEAETLSELRSRDRSARDAVAKLTGVVGQIETLTAADASLKLEAGVGALKAFVAQIRCRIAI